MHRIWGDTFSSPLRFSSCTTNALLTLRIFLTTYFTYFSLPCYFYLLWLTLNTLTHERKTLKRDLSIILNAIIIIPSALIIYRPRWERWEDGRPRMEKRKKIGSRGDNKIEGDKGEDEKYKSNNFLKTSWSYSLSFSSNVVSPRLLPSFRSRPFLRLSNRREAKLTRVSRGRRINRFFFEKEKERNGEIGVTRALAS